MTAIDVALPIVKRWEGFSPIPYLCPAGYWTRGYGERCAPDAPPVTEPEAAENLMRYLARLEPQVLAACPPLAAHPRRLGAVLSWVYNLGLGNFRASTMRRRLLQLNWSAAAAECRRWVWAKGRKLPGLILRREQEALIIGEPAVEYRHPEVVQVADAHDPREAGASEAVDSR